MTGEINAKLTEIVQRCTKNGVRVTFTQYGGQSNNIEQTIEMGDPVVQIQIGNKNDENLLEILTKFLKGIKE